MDIEYLNEATSKKTSSGTDAIISGVYPLVVNSLKSNISKYKRNVGEFINARHEELYAIAPYTRIYWTGEDEDKYWKIMNIKKDVIQGHLNKTYYASIAAFNPRCAKDPFTVTQLMVIRYFLQKNMKKELELACIYLAFSGSFYPSIHYGSFPKVQPSEYRHVMDYVINNELSMKFDLKKEGSILGTIRSICMTWLDSYKVRFKECNDEDVVYLLQQLHNRIKSFMKNIAEIYYKIYDDKDKYLAYDSDNADEENFRVADSNSLKGERYVSTAMTYITTHSVNYKYCKMAGDSNVKTDEIKAIIESIQMDNSNLALVKELMGTMVSEYMAETGEVVITGMDFLTKTIAAKPNSKNKNINRQKEIVVQLLNENAPAYKRRRSRVDTDSSYRRSILTYYALVLQQSNK